MGDVHLHFLDQLTFTPDAVQVANKQQLEQYHRSNRRAATIGTVQMPDLIADEIELNEGVDLT